MRVAVIGGGYAGMAAAVTLADAGAAVTVYEAGPHPGGRARRVIVNGVALDNGLHVLVGAYRETLALIEKTHPHPQAAFTRLPLDWRVHARFRLKAAPLPAPLHLAIGLLLAEGAPWRERLAAMRFMRSLEAAQFHLEREGTVSALLAQHAQGPLFTRHFWEPLCLAALNTPPDIASARVFSNVLRDGLAGGRHASDILLARTDLTALFPGPAASYVEARGARVLTGRRVLTLELDDGGVAVVTQASRERYEHAICAAGAQQAAALFSGIPVLASVADLLTSLRYQPIYSVFLQFEQSVRLPAPMLGTAGIAQWIFDREAICAQRGLVGAVISGTGPHEAMTQDELARAVHAELAREFGPLPALAWHRVIAEKRATFECSVGVERPETRTPAHNVHLAGDHTASDYPATLESAVRSGIAAARQALGTTSA